MLSAYPAKPQLPALPTVYAQHAILQHCLAPRRRTTLGRECLSERGVECRHRALHFGRQVEAAALGVIGTWRAAVDEQLR